MPIVTQADKRPGILFTLVGPGGAGKNALINTVLAHVDNLCQLPTATTRPKRPKEQQGREHEFVTIEQFRKMIAENALIEWQEVHQNRFYGTPRATVEKAIANGEDLIADIDVFGATRLHAAYPAHTVRIFIAPPSMQELEKRMRERGENEEEIAKRLQRAEIEMPYQTQCDRVIVNHNLATAVQELESIIQAERKRRINQIVREKITE
jgi:guanylate kinase